MYLSVCPDSLDATASGLAALASTFPTAAQVVADLEALGSCLPGLAAPAPMSRSTVGVSQGPGDPWGQSVRSLTAAWVAHSADLRRAAHSYRALDDRLLQ